MGTGEVRVETPCRLQIMSRFLLSALTTLMTVPETVPVMVTEPAAGAGEVEGSPPLDPPPLQEPRASKSVTQATS